MCPKRIGSHRVDYDKGNGLDQSDNNHLPYGPYKVAWESGNEIFAEKEDPYNHSYNIYSSIAPRHIRRYMGFGHDNTG